MQVSSPLAVGTYAVQAQAVDAAGNMSGANGSLTLTIVSASAIPPTPAAPVLLPADDSGVVGDGITTVRRPRLTGSTVPGDSVDLLDGSGNVLGSATASADGSFTVRPDASLAIGPVALRFRVRDAAGNRGAAGPALNLRIAGVADDFGGEGESELGVFRPATGQWFVQPSGGGASSSTFGALNLGDIPVPGDYDGTGRTELAVFRPATAQWFILGPSGVRVTTFGAPNLDDIPVPGDYDGTGRTELAVFRPATAQWFILGPGGVRVTTFGAPNLDDVPVPGDYDGTGRTELAVFRPATAQWFILGPGGVRVTTFGAPNLDDVPVPGDYDGTGRTELAVFRPATAQWFILGPSGVRVTTFGAPNLYDLPLEAPVASLEKLGVIGGVKTKASLDIATPQAVQEPGTSTPSSIPQAPTSAASPREDRVGLSAVERLVAHIEQETRRRVPVAVPVRPAVRPRRHDRGGHEKPGALR